MPDVVVVRGSGGSLFEMDVPTRGHAAEIFEQAIALGELTIVTDPVEWVEINGARHLRFVDPALIPDPGAEVDVEPEAALEPEAAPRRRGRPPKVREEAATEPEQPTEAEPDEG